MRCADGALFAGAITGVDVGHVGQHDEHFRIQPRGQQAAGEVLVDHSLDAKQFTVSVVGDRDTTTTGANHGDAAIDQHSDDVHLYDPLWFR